MNSRPPTRSSSVGALPREKKHFVSRAESVGPASLDVRCACQYFQTDSLLPERLNPVGSRPESKVGFVHESHGSNIGSPSGLLVSRPDIQIDQLSTKSFGIQHERHPEADRISIRSFGGQRSFEKSPIGGFGLPRQATLDQFSQRGLVVRSISDANEGELMPSTWQQREMSIERHSKDFDTISNRSVGLRRISRTPSKQDLYVADINIPSTISKPMSRIEIPQIPQVNVIAPTPTPVDSRGEFSVLEEFRRNKAVSAADFFFNPEDKENLPEGFRPFVLQNQDLDLNYIENKVIVPENNTQQQRQGQFQQQQEQQKWQQEQQQQEQRKQQKQRQQEQQREQQEQQKKQQLQQEQQNQQQLQQQEQQRQQQLQQQQEQNKQHQLQQQQEQKKQHQLQQQQEQKKQHQLQQQQEQQKQQQLQQQQEQKRQQQQEQKRQHQLQQQQEQQRQQQEHQREQQEQQRQQQLQQQQEQKRQQQLQQQQEQKRQHQLQQQQEQQRQQREQQRQQQEQQRQQQLQQQQEQRVLQLQQQKEEQQKQQQLLQQPQNQNQKDIFKQAPTSQPQLLKRHHPPEEESPPVMEIKQEPTEKTRRKNSLHVDEESSFFPSLMRKMSFRASEPRELAPQQNTNKNDEKSNEERSPHLLPNVMRKMSLRRSAERELSPQRIIHKTSIRPNEESSSHLFPNIMRKMSLRPSAERDLVPQLSLQVIEGPKKVVQQKPGTGPVASTVTETFSLKVDEMDQYAPKPAPFRRSESVGPSRERSPFTRSVTSIPISMSTSKLRTSQPQLFRGSQSQIFRSSQQNIPADISALGHSEINRELVSVPIGIPTPTLTPQESFEGASEDHLGFVSPNIEKNIEQPQTVFSSHGFRPMERTTSESGSQKTLEQKIMQSNLLRRKQYFSSRARSQDRVGGSNIDLQYSKMMKTVSFDFGDSGSTSDERKSKLPAFESRTSSLSKDKRDWLDRTYFMRDHEYEPIGAPSKEQAQPEPRQPQSEPPQQPQPEPQQPQPEPQQSQSEPENEISAQPSIQPIPTVQVSEPMDVEREITTIIVTVQPDETIKPESDEVELTAEEFQRDIDDRYFSSVTTTPRTESRTEFRSDNIHSSQVDSSAIEELPPKAENRRKSFMASAQDKGKKVQAGLKSQAVKIKSKIRGIKKPPTGSPKKERKRFKAPEFSKMKMPEMKFKGPDMSKFKAPEFKKIEFKRPEFTKFNKPDMSKFKMPEKLSSLKLKRSKSLKETETIITTETITESSNTTPKKTFEFSFGTYPRALRRKKEKKNDIPTSSETPPSFESATIPRGARDKGPVGSKWIDKFSDISYGDSESGKYQRYESSEPESIEPRESSLERKIRENLDRVAKEDEEFETLQTAEQKQFAEFDEENRAIHEISKIRENEFKKRRPMVHQDSDLVSEESKEIGWTEKDIIKNKLLTQTNAVDNEKFAFEDGLTNTNLETQSSGSSSALRQKGVIEEIDDDEFFLRKRGISQDNIEIRQYISTAIREGFDTPINALAKLGNSNESYPDEMVISNEQMEYGYDVPPPKPRRAKRFSNFDRNAGDSAEVSQEFDIEQKENYDDNISLPRTGSDYFKHLPPNRPLRKSKKQYSQDSQEVTDAEDIPYFDDEQMFFKRTGELNNLGSPQLTKYDNDIDIIDQIKRAEPPKAPKRRRKNQLSESTENNGYLNGFAGRSISNTYLPNDDQLEELVVYRTEHEYVIPLAQPEQFTPLPTPPTRSRSRSRITDDHTSLGVDSLVFHEDENNFKVQMKQNDGYAVVKKEPPPRPPAPLRRKRSTNSFDQRFATMPNIKNGSPVPQRPKRNYSTIGPARPARRKSSETSVDIQKDLNTSDATQYEELDVDIEDFEHMESQKNLQSGHIIRKMKDRPLPPPPRPPRENRKHKHINNDNDENDKGGGGEKIISDLTENGDYEIEKSFEKCIEVEASTQTDPLPDDFVCEEFEITDDMKIIEPRRPKTLEDILKEEQEAEFERAKQLADEEYLSYGLQRFRESNQRSISERSRGSTAERSKHSRPTTPSAILIERRVPTPLPYLDQTLVEASLIVQPVDDDEIVEKIESEPAMSEQKSDRSDIKSEGLPDEEQIVTSDTGSHYQEEEERLRENLLYKLGLKKKEDKEYKSKYLDERNVSLEPSLEEQTISNQDQSILKQDERFEENVLQEETLSEPELPPQPPPRRRSSNALTTDQAPETTSEVLPSAPPTSNQLMPISELSPAPVQAVTPNRLAVADLEVERLNVHALQAAQITVSELHGSLISADDLDCKSGNLVVRNLELPPGLIEEIVERVRSSERPQIQAQTQTTSVSEELKSPTTTEEPPARPPPPPQHQIFPSEYMQYSIPPPSFYQLRSPTDDDTMQPLQPHRRRRHYRRRDSSSDEESYRERRRSRQGNRSPDQTIAELGGQLMNACGTSVVRTMNSILNYLRASEKDGVSRNNISAAIVILILATLGFLLFGLSGKNIHHHHWDFFNLPGNDGRGSKT